MYTQREHIHTRERVVYMSSVDAKQLQPMKKEQKKQGGKVKELELIKSKKAKILTYLLFLFFWNFSLFFNAKNPPIFCLLIIEYLKRSSFK